MFTLGATLVWSIKVWLFALFGVVGYQLLTGRINTKGMLWGRTRDGQAYFSPERIQLLLATLAMAGYYLTLILEQNPPRLMDVDPNWIAALGGSHALYLGGKAFAMFGVGGNNRNGNGNKS